MCQVLVVNSEESEYHNKIKTIPTQFVKINLYTLYVQCDIVFY